MARKKIIIFGATGNIGSYLTLYALDFFDKSQYEVVASDVRNVGFWGKQGVSACCVDVTREADFASLPQEDVHAVIHLGAQVPSHIVSPDPRKYIDSIVVGTTNVREYCRKVKADRICFAQTALDVALYPYGHVVRPDEKPRFSYKGDFAVFIIAKQCAMELMEHYHQEYGLKNFVFRFPTIYEYSPFHYYYPNGIKTMRPLYRQIDHALKGEPLTIWGDPNYAKDMVHVYDCAQMICKACLVDRDGGCYNVGTGHPVTLKEQCQAIIDVFSPKDKPSSIIYIDSEKQNRGGYQLDIANAKQELGYEPQYDVHGIFENFKEEMALNRFRELREE